MKKKRILAGVLAAGIAAASVIAFAACKPEETVPAPLLPDGAGVTVDGVYEQDVFDSQELMVLIDNEDGRRIYINSGYADGLAAAGKSIEVGNYSPDSEVSPFPGVAERNCMEYEWKPCGLSYEQWLDALEAADDQAAVDGLLDEDYVSYIIYQDEHPVAYFVWKYVASAEAATFGGEFRVYEQSITRTPVVGKAFPLIGGEYQTIDRDWLQDRIDTFVEMHREATEQHPA